MPVLRLAVGVALLLLAPLALTAEAQSSDSFPVEERTLYLTGERGDVPDTDIRGELLLKDQLAGTGGPAPGLIVPILAPLGLSMTFIQWYWNETWTQDREVAGDVIVRLYYSLQVQGSTQLRVALFDVAPDGTGILVAEQLQRLSVPDLLPHDAAFTLPGAGATLLAGHTLRLDVSVEDLSILTTVQYDAAATPAAVESLPVRILDSDRDGLSDTAERAAGLDPFDDGSPGDGLVDPDRDGLASGVESSVGSDPFNADSDGDGVGDGVEFYAGSDPTDAASRPSDRDGDGVPDSVEEDAGTDPDDSDSDGDGVPDSAEDSDGDGLSDLDEAAHGTDAGDSDTDGDGTSDGAEVALGTDPRHAAPGSKFEPREIVTGAGFAIATVGACAFGLLRRFP